MLLQLQARRDVGGGRRRLRRDLGRAVPRQLFQGRQRRAGRHGRFDAIIARVSEPSQAGGRLEDEANEEMANDLDQAAFNSCTIMRVAPGSWMPTAEGA